MKSVGDIALNPSLRKENVNEKNYLQLELIQYRKMVHFHYIDRAFICIESLGVHRSRRHRCLDGLPRLRQSAGEEESPTLSEDRTTLSRSPAPPEPPR